MCACILVTTWRSKFYVFRKGNQKPECTEFGDENFGCGWRAGHKLSWREEQGHWPLQTPTRRNLHPHPTVDVTSEQAILAKLNACLRMYPKEEEIHHALFSLPAGKSPSLDGIPANFYKYQWSIVKADFIAMVIYFFHHKYLLKSLNNCFITLIPKKQSSTSLGDYWPISFAIVPYNVISKILSTWLVAVQPDLILYN